MGAKHQDYDLKQLQSLSLEAKVNLSKQRIQEWYEHFHGQVYISFSGGKDSTVLLHLVREMYPEVEAVYCDTGLEYPEIKQFVKSFENVTITKPEKNFRQVILDYGYPVISKENSKIIEGIRMDGTGERREKRVYTKGSGAKLGVLPKKYEFLLDAPFKISARCCGVMKKAPLHKFFKQTGKYPYLGTLADESLLRKRSWEKHGCNAYDIEFPASRPLSFWTEADILTYIRDNNIKIASVYGEIVEDKYGISTTGCDRTGCIYCLYGAHIEKPAWRRIKRLATTHPKIYEYCMKPIEEGGLGLKEVIDYMDRHFREKAKYVDKRSLKKKEQA